MAVNGVWNNKDNVETFLAGKNVFAPPPRSDQTRDHPDTCSIGARRSFSETIAAAV